MIFQWIKSIVVWPHKVWREAVHGILGTNCFGKICWGTFLHGGLMNRSYAGQWSFKNALSSNLKTVNLKTFAIHEEIYT